MQDPFDALETRLLKLLSANMSTMGLQLDCIERQLHAYFSTLDHKVDQMTTTQQDVVQDLADLQAAEVAQSAAIVTMIGAVNAAVAGLDDLAKKVADAVAGAADFTAISTGIRAVKQQVLDATGQMTASSQSLTDAVTRDDPAPAPPVVVTPPVDTPPVDTPPVDTPPAA